jgi:drug/metabolite transporter (DMT)-like permease
MGSRASALLLLAGAAVLWSTSGILLKSLPAVHWAAVAGVRSLFAAILFLPGLTRPRPPGGQLLAAIIVYAILVSCLMGSMQLGTAAQGIWLQYVAPAVVALWAVLVRRERLRAVEGIAVLVTMVAVALIVAGGTGRNHVHSVVLGVISGIAYGIFIILLKGLDRHSPSSIFVWTNLGTALIVLPICLASRVPLPTTSREVFLLAVMGLGQLALGYHLFQIGLARTRAVEASLIVLLEPILNPIWVYLAMGEAPPPKVIAGCALIGMSLAAMVVFPNRGRFAAGADIHRD